MGNRVGIITFSSAVGNFYCNQLRELFGDSINIKKYAFDDNTIENTIEDDVVVISTYSIYETVKGYISDKSKIIITSITISKEGLNEIMKVPPGSKAMLVNLSIEMCIETIALLYHLGASHIELLPVYPGIKDVPPVEIAITPGESRYVPENVPKIIDIGHRLLDMSTVIEIALKLNLEYILHTDKLKSYFSSIATSNYSLEELTGKANRLESQFDFLLNILDEGIIGINAHGAIFALSKSAEKIIGIKKGDALGKDLVDILPEIPFDIVSNTLEPIKSKLIKINDIDINLNLTPVLNKQKFIGAFAKIQRFKDVEYQQHKLRSQLINKGYRAKYTFGDIIGTSPAIIKTKEIAEKMAKAEAPILITGESGTGKELFAQSIHSSSYRREFPFVAVNCAAIPENLLESELFGYEEGAFTGAKKGGKLGLFEFAHMGTLFLDEIEEMSIGLQAKLLRVLQEKEVMRIGGDSIINVDVRIVAATNEDLFELVKKGDFRKDLYYRLNVLPLNIPPLRERGKDILLLVDEIKSELGSDFEMSLELKDLFLNHSWDGNVRELRNYVEYLTYVGNKTITPCDLPLSFSLNQKPPKVADSLCDISIEEFKKTAGNRFKEYIFVLEQLSKSRSARISIGRRTIAKAAENMNMFLTEPEIRNILSDLERLGLVKISKGRGGTKITESGLQLLDNPSMG